ncbi:MAG: Bro-N domain-containing protein [Candidatus Peribacteraceae bacterium]|nr:Bro-N domain-containing protein [Candidatus Peribacteraceae bacterium]
MDTTKIALFKGRQIRRKLHHGAWWFSIVDVIAALTESTNPNDYWYKMKIRVQNEDGFEPSTVCRQLKLEAPDGKMRETDCANTEGIFRIVQSIPSPKAEPFKRWLAKVGYERVQEIENPELATRRTRMLYKLKGYSDDWIGKRMRGIAIREELTGEWKNRGAAARRDYEILTAEISKATFGVTPHDYKKLKGLKREHLRDHMDDLELIFTMLGERGRRRFTEPKIREACRSSNPMPRPVEASRGRHGRSWRDAWGAPSYRRRTSSGPRSASGCHVHDMNGKSDLG